MRHRVIEEIVASNEWRDREFAHFKVNYANVEAKLWCRMCIPMIYAHWEGYVVSSLSVLIEHLNSLRLSAEQIPVSLVVVGLGNAYGSLSGKQTFEQKIQFTEKFSRLIKDTISFQKKIDTKSNLKSDVLQDICRMYGFNGSRFLDVSPEIDRLVHIRNSIAHGENSIVPTVENVEKYIASVNMAMDILREEIEIFLSNEKYLMNKV